jgi:hypothetical protein
MPVREKGEGVPVRRLHVPSHVPGHTQTAAKVRGFSPTAPGCTAEIDSPLEQSGFELSVPLALKLVVSRKRELDGGILIGDDDGMIP